MLNVGGTVGSYEVVALIGEGGVGIVYRVRHRVLGTDHALKVLRPERLASDAIRQRFLDEARIQAQLRHPHILTVTDVVSGPGVAGLVMELVEGPSLAEEIQRRTHPPTPDEVRAVALPVLAAVGFAHAKGIVHRDLKPENILLGRDFEGGLVPKVTDFGIAKVLGDGLGAGIKKSTVADRPMGTQGYMSPEQIRSAKDVDHRTDIFALGATFLEYATLRPAFAGDSDFDVMRAIVDGSFEIPATLAESAPAVATAFRRALAPDREQRTGSCAEFRTALSTTAQEAKPPEPRRQPPAESAWPVAAERARPDSAEAAVRAAASKGERFAVVGDGTVVDTQTNLMWPATDNGADIDWPCAKRYAESLTLAGCSDWRLPTQDELSVLYRAGKEASGSTAAGIESPPGIRISSYWLWASETRGSAAASVGFSDGLRRFFRRGSFLNSRVLPVRVRN